MRMTKSTKPAQIALVCSALLVSAFLGSNAAYPASSVEVTLTGTVLPQGAHQTAGTHTLVFQGQRWNFKVTDVRVPEPTYPSSVSGWSILNDIGRQKIHLLGNGEFIDTLNKAGTECGQVKIRGILYVSTGALGSASVEEAPDGDHNETCG